MTIAIVFPGQGAQSVGMLTAHAARSAIIDETLAEASEALALDLGTLIRNGPADLLDRTEYTQPALLAAGVALWRLWRESSDTPVSALAGHSLGEWTALCAAGCLSLADAVQAVRRRGEAMQAAVPPGVGAMAAVLGLEFEVVAGICHDVAEGQVVQCANLNMPGQIVIAGHSAAVERAAALALTRGAKRVVPLKVSVPSHCRLMQPASDMLADLLTQLPLALPEIPVIHNFDASVAPDLAGIRMRLVRQVVEPVQWVATVKRLVDLGVTTVLECGPGKVLTGLVARCDPTLRCLPLGEPQQFDTALSALGT